MIKKNLLKIVVIFICMVISGCGKATASNQSTKNVTPTLYTKTSTAPTMMPTNTEEPSATAELMKEDTGSENVLMKQVSSVFMKDNKTGWAISWDGNLMITNDAWKSYQPIYQIEDYDKNASQPSISYVNDTLILICYSQVNSDTIDIHKTKNEGKSWSISHVKDPDITICNRGNIYCNFINNKEGYLLCCGDPAAGLMPKYLFRTKDGGETYQKVADVSSILGYPTGMSFSESGKGFITCTYHGNDDAHLYSSKDKGKTWKAFKVNSDNITYVYVNSYAPYFVGKEGDMLLAYVNHEKDYPQYIMVHSADGGVTWTSEGDLALKSSQILSTSFADMNTVYVVDDSGTLMKKERKDKEWK